MKFLIRFRVRAKSSWADRVALRMGDGDEKRKFGRLMTTNRKFHSRLQPFHFNYKFIFCEKRKALNEARTKILEEKRKEEKKPQRHNSLMKKETTATTDLWKQVEKKHEEIQEAVTRILSWEPLAEDKRAQIDIVVNVHISELAFAFTNHVKF